MTPPKNGGSLSPNVDQARQELREGIKTSRAIVRQSRMLIALAECDRAAANENAEPGIASSL